MLGNFKPVPVRVLCECGCGDYANPGYRFIFGHNHRKPTPPQQLCECGCGGYASPGKRFISGHNGCKRPHIPLSPPMLCKCGCGEYTKPGNVFIHGHYIHLHHPLESPEAIEKHAITRATTKSKDPIPLPVGWKIDKYSKMATNKECGVYLGIFIAERVLSMIFEDVQRMPTTNPGFDIICNNGYKIDVKSAAPGDRARWSFGIKKNKIPDYFLCIVFDDRYNLSPQHLWLIPGHVVNHLAGLTMHRNTIDKWSQYAMPINNVVECCNKLKQGE